MTMKNYCLRVRRENHSNLSYKIILWKYDFCQEMNIWWYRRTLCLLWTRMPCSNSSVFITQKSVHGWRPNIQWLKITSDCRAVTSKEVCKSETRKSSSCWNWPWHVCENQYCSSISNLIGWLLFTLTGIQTRQSSRSAKANETRKVLVGDLILLYPSTATMINKLPTTPSSKVKLKRSVKRKSQCYY